MMISRLVGDQTAALTGEKVGLLKEEWLPTKAEFFFKHLLSCNFKRFIVLLPKSNC